MFNLPLFLVIEDHAVNRLGAILSNLTGTSRHFTVYFLTSREILALFPYVVEQIRRISRCEVRVMFVADSSYDIAVSAAKEIAMGNCDCVIGFGSGKVLDTAKYAAYVSKRIFVCVPSILSNDGLASPIAVLKTDKGKARSFGAKIPDGILVDTTIVGCAPKDLIRAGVGDMVSNFTALHDWRLDFEHNGGTMNDFAYLLSDSALNLLLSGRITSVTDPEFIRRLAEALVLSGLAMEISGSSRPCSGSEHLFSHALDEHFVVKVPHGIQVALGTVASCILQKRDCTGICNFLKAYEVNIRPDRLGIDRDVFTKAWMLAKSTRPERFTILDLIELSEPLLDELYENIMEVIQ